VIAQSSSKAPPHRSSKLTLSLQNTLSPLSHVLLLVHLNPTDQNFEECLSTLQFAERTKNMDIKTKIVGVEENVGLAMTGGKLIF
jgi:hypothetical protein